LNLAVALAAGLPNAACEARELAVPVHVRIVSCREVTARANRGGGRAID
jgi:hypothetical protein